MFWIVRLSLSTDVFCSFYIFSPPYDVPEKGGHRFPIPVPDVDVRFREIAEGDPFGMDGIVHQEKSILLSSTSSNLF